MSQYEVVLEQRTLIATSPTSSQLIPTERYLPGRQIRGALANAWLRRNPQPDWQHFRGLFEGGVRFGPAYPVRQDGQEQGQTAKVIRPTSLSVLVHKYSTGCSWSWDEAIKGRRSGPAQCPACDEPIEPAKGALPASAVRTRTRTGLEIGDSGVARQGVLFSRVGIEPATFVGELLSDDQNLVDELLGIGQVRIGAKRSTSGLALLREKEDAADTSLEIVDGKLVLRLDSPAVFVDETGRPMSRPRDEELTEVLGVPAQVIDEWSRWDRVGGFLGASGLPLHTEIVVTAGSTYLVELDGEPSAEALDRLQRRGIGLRRHEGFGHLRTAESSPEQAASAQVYEVSPELRQEVKEKKEATSYFSFRGFPEVIPLLRAAVIDPTKAEQARKEVAELNDIAATVVKVDRLLALDPRRALAILDVVEGVQ